MVDNIEDCRGFRNLHNPILNGALFQEDAVDIEYFVTRALIESFNKEQFSTHARQSKSIFEWCLRNGSWLFLRQQSPPVVNHGGATINRLATTFYGVTKFIMMKTNSIKNINICIYIIGIINAFPLAFAPLHFKYYSVY